MAIFSDTKISNLLRNMPEDASPRFLNEWNGSRDHRQRIYISYDATNKNSQAGDLEFVEFGHPKDDKGLPVFGYAVAYDRTNSIPLFYEQYPGSIVDTSQLEFMLGKASAYGYANATFILDRGYFSKSNIRTMEEKNYHFIIMVKGMHALVDSVIDGKKGSFENVRDNYIRSHALYGTTVERRLYADDKRPRYIHLYHSVHKQSAEVGILEKKLNAMRDAMDKLKGTVYVFPSAYKRYFDLTYDGDGTFLMHAERTDVVERELGYCGYFCIVTSERMSAADALETYKSRDENEKLFRGDKSYLGDKSMRVHTDERTSAKILIEFVALIIRCRLFTYIRDAFRNEPSKPNYATVPAAIRELEKLEMSRSYDGIYRLDHAVTKRQKDILKCFGMDADQVKLKADEISSILSTQKKETRRTAHGQTKENGGD
jgi:transposase